MPSIWINRAARAWLVVLLPLSIFLGYQAYSENTAAEIARGEISRWHERDLAQERNNTPKGTFSQDPKEEMRRALEWQQAALERRDKYVIAVVLALSLPFTVGLAIFILRWIWLPKGTLNPFATLGQIRSELPLQGRSAVIAGYALCAFVGLLFLLWLAPQKMLAVLISASVQAIGVVVVLWLVAKIRK